MKILQVGKYYSPYQGGIETVLRELCIGLLKNNYNVNVSVSNERNFKSEFDIIDGVKVNRRLTVGKLFSTPISLNLNSSYFNKFDIVHFHLPNPLCLLNLERIKVPKVATIHSLSEDSYPKLSKIYAPFYQKKLLYFDKIVFTSEIMLSNFSKIISDKISHISSVIPIGISESKNIVDKVNNVGEILFVGRLVSYKNIKTLISALKFTKNKVNLSIVGDGPLKAQLISQSKDEGLSERVYFHGSLSEEEKKYCFLKSKIVALPSNTMSEAFGISILEGMMYGKPILTNNLSTGVKSLNIDGVNGVWVKKDCPVLWAKEIDNLIEHPRTMYEMGKKSKEFYLEKFTSEKMLIGYMNLYSQLSKPFSSSFI